MTLVTPHGGALVSRVAPDGADALARLAGLPAIPIDARTRADVEMIAIGGFSPIEGFMGEADHRSVVEDMRLANGLTWPIPITLGVDEATAATLERGAEVALADEQGPLALLEVAELYRPDREREARRVFGTDDRAHPGVEALLDRGPVNVAGRVTVARRPRHADVFERHRLDPADSRRAFAERGWSRVVGFQTRNPVHRAHEYLLKCALEAMDGLFLHPLVGETKSDDIPADVRMRCYTVLLDRYFVRDRVVLAILPAAMRYAGPREAILHAIVRQNYGCSHFIVGRDHAGVGNYYGTYDAQRIFGDLEPGDLEIIPLFFEHTFYCRTCEGMGSAKTCPHPTEQHVHLSGTKVREMLSQGVEPPHEFSRPEVAAVLIEAMAGPAEVAAR
jgi:sulfate adenylyltransferase